MTIEAEVQALTIATTDLLEAVNIGKENLDAAEAAAELAASQALVSQTSANAAADIAVANAALTEADKIAAANSAASAASNASWTQLAADYAESQAYAAEAQAVIATTQAGIATSSAGFAEEFSGPAYSSVAAGEAATAVGNFFRVGNGTTPETYTRYERTSGGSTVAAPLATTAVLAAPGGSSLLGFQPTGVGAVTRTAQDKMREHVSVLDFGADPTGVNDSYAAIMAAINSATYGTGWYVSGPEIFFPAGTYRVSQTIELKKNIRLYGHGSGLSGGIQASLVFDAGLTGIVIHRYNTIGATVENVATTAGDGSTIEGLTLMSTYGAADAKGGHGIWLRARGIVKNCSIIGFVGNGIQVVAEAGGASNIEGNANNFAIDTCLLIGNGEWGLYVKGADANAGSGQRIDCSNNGSGGIWDDSFLGNTYLACHTSDNGGYASAYNTTRDRTSMVTYGGKRYFATYPATTSALAPTVPGTNPAVWTEASAGGVSPWHPEWVSGQPDGAYFVSNQYRASNPNARNVFMGCYEESGYSNSYCGNPSAFVFGATIPAGSGAVLTSDNQNVKIGPALYSPKISYDKLTLPGADGYQFDHVYVNGRWGYTWAGLGTPARYLYFYDRNATTANGYARNIGDGLGPSGGVAALGIGEHFFGDEFQMSFRGLRDSPPTTGTYRQGDRIDNTAPTAGGVLGWVCVASGTPGTWKTFGAISV